MNDPVREVYKLEYEIAATRYQEIYRSMWTIFSYLTAVSAALLAFGANKVEPSALLSLALFPLVFWFWTTYLPLDRYGNNVVIRLALIEEALSGPSDTEPQVRHFTELARGRVKNSPGVLRALATAEDDPKADGGFVLAQLSRARFALGVFFIGIHIVCISQGYQHLKSGLPFLVSSSSAQSAPAPNATETSR